MDKMIFKRMIAKYGVDYTYQTRETHQNDMGEDISAYSEPISASEPILTYNQTGTLSGGNQSENMRITDAGEIVAWTHALYSMHELPMGTLVKHRGQKYTVVAKEDYFDYADTSVYYLRGQTGL